MATAVDELRIERFESLRDKTNEWADIETARLEATATFLRSIKGTAERISTRTSDRTKALALTDVNDFLLT